MSIRSAVMGALLLALVCGSSSALAWEGQTEPSVPVLLARNDSDDVLRDLFDSALGDLIKDQVRKKRASDYDRDKGSYSDDDDDNRDYRDKRERKNNRAYDAGERDVPTERIDSLSDGKKYTLKDRLRETSVRCARCRKSVSGMNKHLLDDEYICGSCLARRMPKCSACHKKIKNGFVEYFDGNYCCESCYRNKSLPRCAECNSPLQPSVHKKLPGGGYACTKHRPLAVTSLDETEDILDEAYDIFPALFTDGLALDSRPRLHLLSLAELQREGKNDSIWIKGFSRHNIRNGRYEHDIYLLKGMSRESMFFQLVHEYAHCWHYENQPEFLACNLYFREGFSEWMAYRALYVLGDTKQRARQLDNVLTEYSTGLKRFLALERKLGSRTAVLDYVKKHTKL